MRTTVVFDVNETLLDLSGLDPHFKRLFGDATIRTQWFALVLRTAMTLTLTGSYDDFVAVGRASLRMIAEERGIDITDSDVAAIGTAMTGLAPHLDVIAGFDLLADAGFRLAALTNSPDATARQQLTNAGLADRLERILTVDSTKQFKPAPAVYRNAAARLAIPIDAMTLVASHDWDVAGAMSAGARGAYVMRTGVVQNPLYPEPDISGRDLVEVANRLVEADN